jgi:hypothetical protein
VRIAVIGCDRMALIDRSGHRALDEKWKSGKLTNTAFRRACKNRLRALLTSSGHRLRTMPINS